MGEPHFPYKEKTLDALVSLREQKNIDLHFTVGEALSCVAAGQFYDQYHNPWDYSLNVKVPETLEPGSDMLEKTLSIVIDEYGYSSSPRIRQVRLIVSCVHFILIFYSQLVSGCFHYYNIVRIILHFRYNQMK